MVIPHNTRVALTVGIAMLCFTAAPMNAMMGRYITTFIGDACTVAGAHAVNTIQPMMKEDAEQGVPYTPLLLSVGALLALGGRISMLTRPHGLLVALLSTALIGRKKN
jgi:hypothetical protein